MVKKIVGLVVLIGFSLAAWFAWDIHNDKSKSIKVIKTTSLYNNWEPLNGQQSISEVLPDEKLEVARIRYGKDYVAIKVKKGNGQSGWLFYHAGSVDIVGK